MASRFTPEGAEDWRPSYRCSRAALVRTLCLGVAIGSETDKGDAKSTEQRDPSLIHQRHSEPVLLLHPIPPSERRHVCAVRLTPGVRNTTRDGDSGASPTSLPREHLVSDRRVLHRMTRQQHKVRKKGRFERFKQLWQEATPKRNVQMARTAFCVNARVSPKPLTRGVQVKQRARRFPRQGEEKLA